MKFIFTFFCLLLLACSGFAKDKPPNVVILLADDLGSQDIGCDGGPVKTPTLDRLAANGVRFTDFHSGAPVCSTARATLLTGRHHLRTGVYTVIQDHIHDMHLRENEVTIAEHLKANQYDTVHLGKWHLGTPFRGMKKPWIDEHGFDYWFATDLNAAPSHRNPKNFWRNRERVGELDGYACQLVVDEAITWLDENRDEAKPFFLNIWFHEPHAPLAAPDEIVKQYGELNDPNAIYSATIDNTDRAIARLVNKLDQIDSLDDTIIIYTSDHGSYLHERNGNLQAGKGSLMEGGIRTPGIIHWPKGIQGGRVESTPAGAVDLLPTICGLIGVKTPDKVHLDGTDLSPILIGNQSDLQRHQPLTWHSPTSQPVVVIREGNYSLVGRRKSEYPKDQKSIETILVEMKVILERIHGRELSQSELLHMAWNSEIKTPEWNRLRSQFVMLNTFQEAWIPMIKAGSGGISQFQLYDLSTDPRQQKDISKRLPEVASRLQQEVLRINADILKEAHDWGSYKSTSESETKPSPRTAIHDAELEALLTKIDQTDLPIGYDLAKHQSYVDARMKALQPEQQSQVGRLWKEKRRLQPNMQNVGMSFVRILEYVAGGKEFENVSLEKMTKIHRLATTKRSVFDAFSYLNRLPDRPYNEETPEDFSGRLLGRLANQEGRVLLKTPPGMDRQAYEGFKTFIRYEGEVSVGNCSACHTLSDFTNGKTHVVTKGGKTMPTLSLRNTGQRGVELRAAIKTKIEAARLKKSGEAGQIDDEYARMSLNQNDVSTLIAFLKLLEDVPDEKFRELILKASVLDTSSDLD